MSKIKIIISTVCCILVLTSGCSSTSEHSSSSNKQFIKSIPVYPANRLAESEGNSIQLTVPISITSYNLTLIEYRTPEEASYITLTEDIFPADIYISVLSDSERPKVFLGRAPQSGCPIEWKFESKIYKAYCDGSEFKLDGTYISGPSSRNLDELPVLIRDGMIWITNTVILGDTTFK